MKKDKEIEKKIREQIKDYQMDVPSNLWDDIEKDLSPKIITHRWRYISAAAVVALCLASSLMVYMTTHNQDSYVNQICDKGNKTINVIENQKENDIKHIINIDKNVSSNSMLSYASRNYNSNKNSGNEDGILKDSDSNMHDEQNNIDNAKRDDKKETDDKTYEIKDTKKRSTYKKYNNITVSNRKHNKHFSIGVNGNTFANSSSLTNDGYMHLRNVGSNTTLMMDSQNPSIYDKIDEKNFANLMQQKATTNIKHKQPLSFGVSLRFALQNDWFIDTGVEYTYLSSELTYGNMSSSYMEEQKLHYMGIPLQVGHDLWSGKLFSLYALAGGEIERCIAGKLETIYDNTAQNNESESISNDKLQLSFLATVGMQYKLNNNMSLYFEPNLHYYFDDGSEYQTIRKEHPFTFNLKFGLRFNIGK